MGADREDSRGTFQAISSLFSVVLRLDLSDIRWMHDSSIHTSRNVRVYALFFADMRAPGYYRAGAEENKVTPNPDKVMYLFIYWSFRLNFHQ
jgi:hypothetical protein